MASSEGGPLGAHAKCCAATETAAIVVLAGGRLGGNGGPLSTCRSTGIAVVTVAGVLLGSDPNVCWGTGAAVVTPALAGGPFGADFEAGTGGAMGARASARGVVSPGVERRWLALVGDGRLGAIEGALAAGATPRGGERNVKFRVTHNAPELF